MAVPMTGGGTSQIDPAQVERFIYSFKNSIIITLSVTIISLLFGSLAGYAFARLKFKGSGFLFFFYLITRMIPGIVLIVPLYFIIKLLGLQDTLISLIGIYSAITLPFVILILRGYFQELPVSLEDAARIDGCSRIGIIFKIVLPIAKPALAATGLISFMTAWAEFPIALVLTTTKASRTVPVVVAGLMQSATIFTVDRGLIAAIGLLGIVPPVVLALLFRNYLLKGLTRGAEKY